MDKINTVKPKTYSHEYNPADVKDVFAVELEHKLAQSLSHRLVLDERFVKDLRMYHGQYSPKVLNALKEAGRSQVFMNLVRAKTDAGESQLVDLLFPMDDKNWGINPTPKPDLAKQTTDDSPFKLGETEYQYEETGERVKVGDIAKRKIEKAQEAADEMETLITDQLVETDYNAKSRLCIHDACVIGTGVMKGPVVNGRMNRSYQPMEQGGYQAVIENRFVPGTETVRPWDFFPDPSAATIEECEFVFERRYLSRKQVRNLIFQKGFKKEQVVKVLGMKSQETHHKSGFVDDIRALAGLNQQLNDTRYELWEYHGPIDKELLLDWGVKGVKESELDDPLSEVTGVVHYCGGVVLSVKIHLIDYDQSMPYRVFNWVPDDSNIFGFGIPHICEHQQDVLNSTVRMMQDNAAITAGPQIGVNPKKISPMDGQWTMKPFKFWNIRDGVQDIKQAFTTVEFNSHLGELQSIYNLARVLIDEVSGVPMLQQGEQGQSTHTLGGMSMLMNAANTVRRRQVKLWDDNVTKPLIKDFYHFNMLYSEEEKVKGDFQVEARGTSALLIKEQVAQSISNFLSVIGSSEAFSPVLSMKAREILEGFAKTQTLPTNMVPTKEEFDDFIEAQQEQASQQSDPQLSVEQMRAETAQLKFQHETQLQQADHQFDAQQKELDRAVKMLALQEQSETRISQERQEMMRLAQLDKISQDKLLTELEKLDAKLKSDWDTKTFEAALKREYGKTGNYGVE